MVWAIAALVKNLSVSVYTESVTINEITRPNEMALKASMRAKRSLHKYFVTRMVIVVVIATLKQIIRWPKQYQPKIPFSLGFI